MKLISSIFYSFLCINILLPALFCLLFVLNILSALHDRQNGAILFSPAQVSHGRQVPWPDSDIPSGFLFLSHLVRILLLTCECNGLVSERPVK